MKVFLVVFVGHVGGMHSHNKIAVQHIDDFYLSVFVLFILKDPFDGDDFAGLFESALKNLSKGTLSDKADDFDVVVEDAGSGGIKAALGFHSRVFLEVIDFF